MPARERTVLVADIASGRARLALTRGQLAWLTHINPSTVTRELKRRNGGAR
jgi:hypothetical protein